MVDPMTNEDQLSGLDKSIQENRLRIQLADAVKRLKSNPDFKLVVINGYLQSEAVRLVHLKADPSVESDKDKQENIDADISAIGRFNQYLSNLVVTGNMAKKTLADDEDTRQELLKED